MINVGTQNGSLIMEKFKSTESMILLSNFCFLRSQFFSSALQKVVVIVAAVYSMSKVLTEAVSLGDSCCL